MRGPRRNLHGILLTTFVTLATFAAFPALGGEAALSRDEAESLFLEAKEAFHAGDRLGKEKPREAREAYRRAALRLERIVREGGIRNGKLFYNLGNAYFRLGRTGRAILNYRRAERYRPEDANLQQNLAYARSLRKDRFEVPERTRVLRTLLFWHYDFPLHTRGAVFAAAFLLFWLGSAARLFRKRACPGWFLTLCALIALLFLGSVTATEIARTRTPAAVIVAGETTGRKGDGTSYQPSFAEPLHAGTECVLLEERPRWRRIELPDGRQTWVPAEAVERVNFLRQ